MNTEEREGNANQAKSKIPEETEKPTVNERERHKGKMDKADNKARSEVGKARRKNQGHEAVSDQKSHEYH
jgi:uncharacterized protein YjbJ (UPF0337 family)